MQHKALAELDLDEKGIPLLLREFDHRIRNLLTVIGATVMHTESSSVEDYQARLMERISCLLRVYQEKGRPYAERELKALIAQTLKPFCADSARIAASGPDFLLEPRLALALYLVFHELALNSKKYGALSSSSGCVEAAWNIKDARNGERKLFIIWSEQGGPEVKRPRQHGFGLRLIKTLLQGYGGARFAFHPAGLACLMSIDLNRPAVRRHQVNAAL